MTAVETRDAVHAIRMPFRWTPSTSPHSPLAACAATNRSSELSIPMRPKTVAIVMTVSARK